MGPPDPYWPPEPPGWVGPTDPAASGEAGPGEAAAGGGCWRRSIDEPTLIAVAERSGGADYPAESAEELDSVFAELPTTAIMDHEVVEVSVAFVGLGALLAALGLLLGRAWRPLP